MTGPRRALSSLVPRTLASLARRAGDAVVRQRPASVRVEVLASLGIVMLLAQLVLVAAAYRHHENTLRATLGPALLAEAREPELSPARLASDTLWWRVAAGGRVSPLGASRAQHDARVSALAAAAAERGAPLLELGALWEPILFAAAPQPGGEIVVARLSRERSLGLRARPLAVFALLALADALVFGAFGFVLLQRRVVAPLEALAGAAREVGDSDDAVSVRIHGPSEVQGVAEALGEMSTALAGRTKELRDAVVELRSANARLRETRDGLERAERLASVGRLAAGVAHEVGNPLGAILAFAELVDRDPGVSESSRALLARLLREGERVRGTLRQLLDLSRPAQRVREPLDLAQAARDAVALVAPQRRYRAVTFEVLAEPDVPLALGDPSAVQQTLTNLLLNAGEATRERTPARVRIAVANGALKRRASDGAADAAERARADAVVCRVMDDGCGIPEEDRERVFDPFFTTRSPGEGTGLGLPNALRMTEEQGGSLELETPPDGFCTAFALRLPVDRAGADARAVRRARD